MAQTEDAIRSISDGRKNRQVAVTTLNGEPGMLDTSLTKTTAQVILAAAIGGVAGYVLGGRKDKSSELKSLEDEIFLLDHLLDSDALREGGTKDLEDVKDHVGRLKDALGSIKAELDRTRLEADEASSTKDEAERGLKDARDALARAAVAWEELVARSGNSGNFDISEDLAVSIGRTTIFPRAEAKWTVEDFINFEGSTLNAIAAKFNLLEGAAVSEANLNAFVYALNDYVLPVLDNTALTNEIQTLRGEKAKATQDLDNIVVAFNGNRGLSGGRAATSNTIERRIRDFVTPSSGSVYDSSIGTTLLGQLSSISFPDMYEPQRRSIFPKDMLTWYSSAQGDASFMPWIITGDRIYVEAAASKEVLLNGSPDDKIAKLSFVLSTVIKTDGMFAQYGWLVPYVGEIGDAIIAEGVYRAVYAYFKDTGFASSVDSKISSNDVLVHGRSILWDILRSSSETRKRDVVSLCVLFAFGNTLKIVRDNSTYVSGVNMIARRTINSLQSVGSWA